MVNRTVKSCQAFEDDIVYGKVDCSASAFKKAVEGKKVTGAGQQGKYFYVTFDTPPHSVMHLGMTGWIKFSAEDTGYYKQAKESDKAEEWPPKYMKFLLKCEAEKVDGKDRDPVEIAFVDARRLARIRLVNCEAGKIRQHTPLKENGPDPVIDKDVLTQPWLAELMRKKKVPIKALLLDQGNISGVGNWVADEVLYQARIHPEQYSNTFDDEQVKRLHDALTDVCTIACSTLADSKQFPETWLMKYRWDKGKKDANILPNGEKIVHLKVGGRTSAVVPSVQKKTAAVAGDVDPADLDDAEAGKKPPKARKRKAEDAGEDEVEKKTIKADNSKANGTNGTKAKPASSDKVNGKLSNGDKDSTKQPSNVKKEVPTASPTRTSARTRSRK